MNKSLVFISIVFFLFSCSKKDDVANSNQHVGDLNINSSIDLQKARKLKGSVANIIGNVTISLSSGSDITAAELSEVTSLFQTITGNLFVNTDQSIDFSSLRSVSEEYRVFGSDVQDDALNTVGSLYISYSGDYDYPNLESAGEVVLYENLQQPKLAAKGRKAPLSRINFENLKTNNKFNSFGYSSGSLFFSTASVLILGEGVQITSVLAPSLERLELKYSGTLSTLSLIVSNIQTITINASSITQNFTIQGSASASVNAPNLTTVGGNVSVSANSVSFTSLTTVGGTLEIQANSIEQNTGQPHNSGGSTGG